MAARKSRLQRIESRKATRTAFLYIVFSVIAVALLLKYGITAVSSVSRMVAESIGDENVTQNDPGIPPQPPRLEDVPRYTNSDSLTINGNSIPGYDIIVVVNGEKQEVIANAQGNFSAKVSLNKNEPNVVFTIAKNEAGLTSRDSEKFTIEYDNEPPTLEIISPGNEIFGESNRTIQIEGQTEPGASVHINDRVVIVRSDGKFDFSQRLSDGENTFLVKATDEAGNETEAEKKITFIK